VPPESADIVRIEWDWGDGMIYNSPFPALHQYIVDGVYNVTVRPFDDVGNYIEQVFDVEISDCEFSDNSGVAYLFQFGSWGNGPGEFMLVAGIETDRDGHIYITGWDNNRIQKFDAEGNFLLEWGTIGSGEGQFRAAADVSFDSEGTLYAVDVMNSRIQKFDTAGQYLGEWPIGMGFPADIPVAVEINSLDEIHVVNYQANRVDVFDSDGNLLRKWGEFGEEDGQFRSPVGIAIDRFDNVFVMDNLNFRVQKFTAEGEFITKFGSKGSEEGQFTNSQFIALDTAGNLYVTDEVNPWVQKFDAEGNYLARFGSEGRGPRLLGNQRGIAVSSAGLIYISDYFQGYIFVYGAEAIEEVDENYSGEISTDDGQLALSIDAGDLAAPETISVRQTAPEEISADLQVGTSEGQGEILAAYTLEPDGLEFAQAVELAMTIDITGLSQVQRDNLDIYLHTDTDDDGIEDTFLAQGAACVIDGAIATCTVQITHFSAYVLIVPAGDDDDGDFLGASIDLCPGTTLPEGVPTKQLGKNRWALIDGDLVFDTSPASNPVEATFTIAGTKGCSCEQIIKVLGLGEGQSKFGCSSSVMNSWIESNAN
ncbi:6-bladed beta-propeller, partial [Pseudomonadota bacterium]